MTQGIENNFYSKYKTIRQASGYTSICQNTLYDLVRREEIINIRVGRRIYFDVEDLDKFMLERKSKPEFVDFNSVNQKVDGIITSFRV